MSHLRTLLFALLLPVLVLPDGIIVCLHRLLGDEPARSCCTSCCSGARADAAPAAVPRIKNVDCTNCCVALPTAERSLNPTTKKLADPAPAPAPVPMIAPPHRITLALPLASSALARAVRLRPPPPVTLALPLRR